VRFQRLSVLTRGRANNLLESICQVTLAAEPYLSRHLCQRFAGPNQPLCDANPYTLEVRVGRHAHFGLKNTQQAIGTERDILSRWVRLMPSAKHSSI
jgi:hypothetical protein